MTAAFDSWLAEPLSRDVARSIERLRGAGDVVRVAAMPDVHLSEDVCVGLVVATTRRIYPAAVGGDIGCGMTAVRFDCGADALASETAAARLLTELYRRVPVLIHERSATDRPLPDGLEDGPLSAPSLVTRRRRDGRIEFGTVGRGNHFVEFQEDEEGALWLLVHSGSRAMGGAIRDQHLAGAHADEAAGLRYLDADDPAGCAYLADHSWALRYAAANRAAIADAACEAAARALGATCDPASRIECSHNHVRRETHAGRDLWVHRKGAAPAQDGEPGIVPGSMGTASFHTLGRGCPESLASSSHGAGRAMSRSDARRRVTLRQFEREVEGVWFDRRLARRLVEEAPSAYRDVRRVMRAQRELTRVVRRLRPVLVYKGT
jgi:tRNA-splicing ligase RtcB